jgi:hypothetical protein
MKPKRIREIVRPIACWVAILALWPRAAAQEAARPVDHTAVLAPFIDDDTFAVLALDLDSLNAGPLFSHLLLAVEMDARDQQRLSQSAAKLSEEIGQLRSIGARYMYLVYGVAEIQREDGPLVLVQVPPGGQANATERLRSMFTAIGNPPLTLERHPAGALMIGMKSTVDRYALRVSIPRNDLTAPLAKLGAGNATAAAVLAPGDVARRIVRERWRQLPEPVSALTAPLLADRLRNVEALVRLDMAAGAQPTAARAAAAPPADADLNVSARIEINTTGADSAAAFRKVIQDVEDSLPKWRDRAAAETLRAALGELDIRADGSRVLGTMPADATKPVRLTALLKPALEAAAEAGRRNQRMASIRRIMIAMLNYEASMRTLPPAAIRDAEGQPLLSWRVAILPHLGQQGLFARFRLNEPWDSPHNVVLIKQIPAVYISTGPQAAELARAGKTMFQVPVGAETLFDRNEGTKMSEILDGTSNTIWVVEVVPERAVEWTKPADWEVDLQNPLVGVQKPDSTTFMAGFVDGHTEMIPMNIDPKKLRGLLTRAGKEPIERSP